MKILTVRPASYTHKNRWGRIISKDMRPMESASNIYKVNLVKKECVLPPRCVRTAKIPSLAKEAAIFYWVRNSWTDSDSGLFALRIFGPLFLPIFRFSKIFGRFFKTTDTHHSYINYLPNLYYIHCFDSMIIIIKRPESESVHEFRTQ